ncbi:hypothetical protein [Desulfovibrio sp.]|uniref:hypothetical protein n=1 Tax=Desulfovibrio sp. TaxID=885 RepID=UPI003AB916DE
MLVIAAIEDGTAITAIYARSTTIGICRGITSKMRIADINFCVAAATVGNDIYTATCRLASTCGSIVFKIRPCDVRFYGVTSIPLDIKSGTISIRIRSDRVVREQGVADGRKSCIAFLTSPGSSSKV